MVKMCFQGSFSKATLYQHIDNKNQHYSLHGAMVLDDWVFLSPWSVQLWIVTATTASQQFQAKQIQKPMSGCLSKQLNLWRMNRQKCCERRSCKILSSTVSSQVQIRCFSLRLTSASLWLRNRQKKKVSMKYLTVEIIPARIRLVAIKWLKALTIKILA